MAERRYPTDPRMSTLPRFIFMSRWLQVPLYVGLIVAQVVYVVQFWVELVHLVEAAMGNQEAIDVIRRSVAVAGAESIEIKSRETLTMLVMAGRSSGRAGASHAPRAGGQAPRLCG